MGDDPPCLQWIGATKRFGGVTALTDFSMDVRAGEIHGLIGPNGAGKSTAVNVATGAYPLDEGRIVLQGTDVSTLPPHERARRGLGRTFQRPHTFGSLTVRENLEIAVRADGRRRAGTDDVSADTVDWLLAALGLEAKQHRLADLLTYGEQKLLAVAQALIRGGGAILLDEPMAGLTDAEVEIVKELIRDLKPVGIVLIEHDVDVVMELCNFVTVMVGGSVIAQGPPADIRTNAQVAEAYLGADPGIRGGTGSEDDH